MLSSRLEEEDIIGSAMNSLLPTFSKVNAYFGQGCYYNEVDLWIKEELTAKIACTV